MLSSISLEFGPLVPARFVERPNRFVVHCRLESSGELVAAHLADPGRLKELLVPDARLYLRQAAEPTRKTRWSVILVQAASSVLVSLQSALVNHLAAEALRRGAIAELAEWHVLRSEYTQGGSRFDFLLENDGGERLLLEVKSCTLVQEGTALFPDAVTARGTRHVQELTELQSTGEFQGGVLFVVQRADAKTFSPAAQIDPRFAQALRRAQQAGVRVLSYNCTVEETAITWGHRLPVDLG